MKKTYLVKSTWLGVIALLVLASISGSAIAKCTFDLTECEADNDPVGSAPSCDTQVKTWLTGHCVQTNWDTLQCDDKCVSPTVAKSVVTTSYTKIYGPDHMTIVSCTPNSPSTTSINVSCPERQDCDTEDCE